MSSTTIEAPEVRVYQIPTDAPESDGTLEWRSTTCVVVLLRGGGETGLGYTYSHGAAALLIRDVLAPLLRGAPADSPEHLWWRMLGAVRNLGRQGIAAHAISAVDVALWDLRARLLGVPLHRLWGAVRERAPVYGSGGFTSYDLARIGAQIVGWRERGVEGFKIKVGRRPEEDLERLEAARRAAGADAALFVDANGAYDRQQALDFAAAFAERGVSWLEEPVSSDDLEGLRLVRDGSPAGLRVAAGEYGYHPIDQRRLLDAGAVDVLQIDATRCLGYTGFLKTAALCDARSMPLSSHCAPALHLPLGLAVERLIHLEYFHDHARIEAELFDGAPPLADGALTPADPDARGHGLRLRDVSAWRTD